MFSFKNILNAKKLVGDPRLFSLEERIFNTFCIIAFITMCFEVPFNYFIGLKVPTILCACGIVISASLFYISRFKRKSLLGIILFSTACNVTFAINYFFNSGIFGPNLLLFSLAFLLVIAIIPKEQFKIWIPLNLLLVLSILIVEYLFPSTAPDVYMNNLSKAIDFGITYFVVTLITYYAISYIRKNYEYERGMALNKTIAIEEQSKRIIQQNEELEKLSTEKDKLFSIVTHDIRAPLNSIQGYLELLADTDLSNEERMVLKQQLLEITRNTSSMLTNVLSWSKTQLEGSHAELVPVDIKQTLANGLNIERNHANRKGVKLDISCKAGIDIMAYQNMFELVMRNLVNNAIKFTPKDGSVTISVKVEDKKCLIIVKDTGLGIDEAQQEKLFKLKASSTYGTNNERGIGLGLMLCKEFTELQGGEIWFESKPQQGSAFYLSFNLVISEQVEQ
ncbi:MAG: HAMP domain-containing histidine kinase [Pedobacter sp.]|nr:MAG: HAMP domain-containing histidine kinase [Pedobacter sp.]